MIEPTPTDFAEGRTQWVLSALLQLPLSKGFPGSRVTSDAGLILVRELHVRDSANGPRVEMENPQVPLADLFRPVQLRRIASQPQFCEL